MQQLRQKSNGPSLDSFQLMPFFGEPGEAVVRPMNANTALAVLAGVRL